VSTPTETAQSEVAEAPANRTGKPARHRLRTALILGVLAAAVAALVAALRAGVAADQSEPPASDLSAVSASVEDAPEKEA